MSDSAHNAGFPPKDCLKCGKPLVRMWLDGRGRLESPSDYRARKSCKTAECSLKHHDGRRQHPLFEIWKGILRRCTDPKCHAYANYAGRGITVCDEWLDFWKFVEDMGPRPPRASIDRIDNDAGYCKANCRWSNHKQQTRNSRLRKNDIPEDAPALSEYSTRLGVTRQAAWHRIQKFGWEAVWNGAGASVRRPMPGAKP